MYILSFPEPTEENDRVRLSNFVSEVENLLRDVVESGQDSQGRFFVIAALHPAMKLAWAGASTEDGAPYRFTALRTSIASASTDSLSAHGLTGPMLAFKLTVLGHWAERYNLLGGWRWFDKIIDLIDELLESILQAVGADGALSELKDFIRASVDEDE